VCPSRHQRERYRLRRGRGHGLLQRSVRSVPSWNQLRRRGLLPGGDGRVLYGRGGVCGRGQRSERCNLWK
jgi:hypothetical protein